MGIFGIILIVIIMSARKFGRRQGENNGRK